MDLIKLVGVLLRRWYVVVPIALLGLACSVLVVRSIPAEYTATGTVIVVEGGTSAGGLTPASLAEALQDGALRQSIAGTTGSYDVLADNDGILRVVSSDPSREKAISIVNKVMDRLNATAKELGGAKVPEIEVLSRPATAVQSDDGYQATGAARMQVATSSSLSGQDAAGVLKLLLTSGQVPSGTVVGSGTALEVVSSRDLPTLAITVTGTSETAVLGTLNNLMDAANTKLTELTALAEPGTSPLVARKLSVPADASKSSSGALRSLVALIGVTLVVAVAAALLLEALAEALAARRARQSRTPARLHPGRPRQVDEVDDDDPPRRSIGGVR